MHVLAMLRAGLKKSLKKGEEERVESFSISIERKGSPRLLTQTGLNTRISLRVS